MKKYLLNCFLFVLPPMLWNILLTPKLPAIYQPASFEQAIPLWLTYAENIARGAMFLIAFLIPLPAAKLHRQTGFWIYLLGLASYFISWILLIDHPTSPWSNSLWGFMAPAYTPALWLAGIALVGNSLHFKISNKIWCFILASIFFLGFHCFHAWLVWERSNNW